MSANSNSTTTLVTVGNREDLDNIITRVVADQTPFVSSIGTVTAKQPYHETQTETLATASAGNAALEGNQNFQNIQAPNLTARIGCRMQIMTKIGEVSGTQEATVAAGRASELARQKLLKGKELARDREMRFVGNYASNAESGGNARKTAGALAWLTSNVSLGSGGTPGGFASNDVAAVNPGAARTFTESLVKSVRATAFGNGATPSVVLVPPTQKQQFSAFTGIADIRADVSGRDQATIYAGADVYVDDFGAMTIVPHPYAFAAGAALIYDPSKFKRATLRAMTTEPLAKTGDANAFQVILEEGLLCQNEKAHAAIHALQ
jgi:hypothetical protein